MFQVLYTFNILETLWKTFKSTAHLEKYLNFTENRK